MGKIIRDNIVAIILAFAGYLIAFSAFAYQKYDQLNEARIRADEQGKMIRGDCDKLEMQQSAMSRDLRDIKVSVERVATIIEQKFEVHK